MTGTDGPSPCEAVRIKIAERPTSRQCAFSLAANENLSAKRLPCKLAGETNWHGTAVSGRPELSAAELIVDHLSIDDRQNGVEFPDRFIRNLNLVEIVVTQHDDVAELALFD